MRSLNRLLINLRPKPGALPARRQSSLCRARAIAARNSRRGNPAVVFDPKGHLRQNGTQHPRRCQQNGGCDLAQIFEQGVRPFRTANALACDKCQPSAKQGLAHLTGRQKNEDHIVNHQAVCRGDLPPLFDHGPVREKGTFLPARGCRCEEHERGSSADAEDSVCLCALRPSATNAQGDLCPCPTVCHAGFGLRRPSWSRRRMLWARWSGCRPPQTASECAKGVVFNATRKGGRRKEGHDDRG